MALIRRYERFDVYWVNLDPSIGSEISKTRPCIIVSPEFMNNILNTVLIIPLTRTLIDWPFRMPITVKNENGSIACDHLRSISKVRLGTKIGVISTAEQEHILNILQDIFTL